MATITRPITLQAATMSFGIARSLTDMADVAWRHCVVAGVSPRFVHSFCVHQL
jgi:hypothetical protein